MKLWLAKVRKGARVGLVPTDDISERAIAKLGDGELIECAIVKARSVQWNRLYWRLCALIGENQEPERDADSIDAELRILAGHFDVMYVGNHEVRVPKRIAFDKLDAEGWSQYWRKVEQAVVYRFGPTYIQEIAA